MSDTPTFDRNAIDFWCDTDNQGWTHFLTLGADMSNGWSIETGRGEEGKFSLAITPAGLDTLAVVTVEGPVQDGIQASVLTIHAERTDCEWNALTRTLTIRDDREPPAVCPDPLADAQARIALLEETLRGVRQDFQIIRNGAAPTGRWIIDGDGEAVDGADDEDEVPEGYFKEGYAPDWDEEPEGGFPGIDDAMDAEGVSQFDVDAGFAVYAGGEWHRQVTWEAYTAEEQTSWLATCADTSTSAMGKIDAVLPPKAEG